MKLIRIYNGNGMSFYFKKSGSVTLPDKYRKVTILQPEEAGVNISSKGETKVCNEHERKVLGTFVEIVVTVATFPNGHVVTLWCYA